VGKYNAKGKYVNNTAAVKRYFPDKGASLALGAAFGVFHPLSL
jgi:hypothetical protein